MADTTPKKYPISTPEVAELLKMGKTQEEQAGPKPAGHFPASDLPVLEGQVSHGQHGEESHAPAHNGHAMPADSKGLSVGNVLKTAAPYALVFGVAILSYYFFFSQVSFDSLFKSRAPKVNQKEKLLSELKDQESKSFQNWINSFYFDVTDPKVVDPDTDNSGNGLTNFQKYLLNLNPKAYDSLGIGMADSEALSRGINPVTGGNLTEDQKSILDKYFDMETIMNRFTLAHMQKQGIVAGASANNSLVNSVQVDPNYVDVDTSKPGRLEIPSLNINVPIMWTEDTRNFDRDLQSGVVHYPGTAMPGQMGTVYVSGHSSNYAWAKGDYNKVFSTLGDLPDNASVKITVVQKNGKDAKFFYVVTSRKEYKPTDQEQFMPQGKSLVALSTCWPVGTTQKRLVVFAEQVQLQKD